MTQNSKKDIFLKLRISPKYLLGEKILIQKKAEECGLSMSDFIRQLSFGYRLRNNAQQKETLRNIARIASNDDKILGQIARQVNTYKIDINKFQLLTALLSIEQEIMEVQKCL